MMKIKQPLPQCTLAASLAIACIASEGKGIKDNKISDNVEIPDENPSKGRGECGLNP